LSEEFDITEANLYRASKDFIDAVDKKVLHPSSFIHPLSPSTLAVSPELSVFVRLVIIPGLFTVPLTRFG